MTRTITALSISASVILLSAAQVHAGEIPKEVRDWFKFSEGTWEVTVKGDVNQETQPGTQTVELAAGGAALIRKGTQIGTGNETVSLDAWEAGKKKVVSNWYTSKGSHVHFEMDMTSSGLKGTLTGADDEGAAITAKVSFKKIDGNTYETTFEGQVGGNPVSFTLITKRKNKK